MKVNLGTIEVNDLVRRAIAKYYGEKKIASRATVRSFFLDHASADLEQVVSEYQHKDVVE